MAMAMADLAAADARALYNYLNDPAQGQQMQEALIRFVEYHMREHALGGEPPEDDGERENERIDTHGGVWWGAGEVSRGDQWSPETLLPFFFHVHQQLQGRLHPKTYCLPAACYYFTLYATWRAQDRAPLKGSHFDLVFLVCLQLALSWHDDYNELWYVHMLPMRVSHPTSTDAQLGRYIRHRQIDILTVLDYRLFFSGHHLRIWLDAFHFDHVPPLPPPPEAMEVGRLTLGADGVDTAMGAPLWPHAKAFRVALEQMRPDDVLVHGYIRHPTIPALFLHAWVERQDGLHITHQLFGVTKTLTVDEFADKFAATGAGAPAYKYTIKEAKANVSATGIYGPWDEFRTAPKLLPRDHYDAEEPETQETEEPAEELETQETQETPIPTALELVLTQANHDLLNSRLSEAGSLVALDVEVPEGRVDDVAAALLADCTRHGVEATLGSGWDGRPEVRLASGQKLCVSYCGSHPPNTRISMGWKNDPAVKPIKGQRYLQLVPDTKTAPPRVVWRTAL